MSDLYVSNKIHIRNVSSPINHSNLMIPLIFILLSSFHLMLSQRISTVSSSISIADISTRWVHLYEYIYQATLTWDSLQCEQEQYNNSNNNSSHWVKLKNAVNNARSRWMHCTCFRVENKYSLRFHTNTRETWKNVNKSWNCFFPLSLCLSLVHPPIFFSSVLCLL